MLYPLCSLLMASYPAPRHDYSSFPRPFRTGNINVRHQDLTCALGPVPSRLNFFKGFNIHQQRSHAPPHRYLFLAPTVNALSKVWSMPKPRNRGVSRKVDYVRASAGELPNRRLRTLASEALAREREQSHARYLQHLSGLSSTSVQDLANGTGSAIPADLAGEGAMHDDWQDVADDVMGSDMFADAVTEENNVVFDLRDVMASRQQSRFYRDHRTWKLRRDRHHQNWGLVMEEVIDAYLTWRNTSELSSQSVFNTPTSPEPSPAPSLVSTTNPTTTPSTDLPTYEFTIPAIDIHSMSRTVTVQYTGNISAAAALVKAGYLGNSPLTPSRAISIKTLELFRVLRMFRPSLSIEAFARTTCYIYFIPYQRRYRNALSDAFDVYLHIRRVVDERLAKFLKRDTPDYRVLHACPPCSYELVDEPELRYRRMLVMDGNNSLKRIKGIGNRQASDTRLFEASSYFLSPKYVDEYAHEVQRHTPVETDDALPPSIRNDPADELREDVDQETDEGDPTDGVASGPSGCTDNWKAAALDAKKKMWAIFDEAGIFACACRHGFVLWLVDMLRSGELAKYPLSIVAKALKILGPRLLLAYDIGCQFETTIATSSLGASFAEAGCRCCVNAFHGYSHNYLCQLQNHPNTIEGVGLEDLETLERIFSASNALASVTRYMTSYRRRVFIDLHFQHWDSEKYANLADMLHQNYRQALKIIDVNTIDVRHVLELKNIDETTLEAYIADERNFFETLGKEPEGDLHAIAYVESLQELWRVEQQLDEATSRFRTQTPQDYQFVAPERSYAINLSETRRADTTRRYLNDRRETLIHELIQYEVRMNISPRWTPSSREYQATSTYMANRKYEQALDTLQNLVIRRLFELHKLNLSQTGYRMRTHIAKSLQTRSKAIRNAVQRYNTFAAPLGHPLLDWSKVSHYSFLDDFNILRHTRQNVHDRPWADPVIRETMRKHQRLLRAREEIQRCNIEIRRLHTAIVDENCQFDSIQHSHAATSHDLAADLRDFIVRRRRVNGMLLARIMDTYALPGFSGNPTPGTALHPLPELTTSNSTDAPSSAPAAQPSSTHPFDSAADSDSDSDEEPCEEVTGDLGRLVDFISDLS